MNKTELINQIAKSADIERKTAEKAVNALFDTLIQTMEQDEKVQIMGFGTFEMRHRPERTGRNPSTGEPVTVAATDIPTFKPSKRLIKK